MSNSGAPSAVQSNTTGISDESILKKELLDYVSGFQVLSPEEIDLIMDNTLVKSFKKGAYLLEEGQVADKCYFVLKGCVREFYLIDGEEKSTAFYTEGQAVNSFSSYTNQQPSRHYLICAEDCVLTVGNQQIEKEMCQRIPRLESIIRQEVERNTGKAQDDFARFMVSSPEQRYLQMLEDRPELLQRIPQHQLASYIGVTAESLSRIRKRLHKQT